LTHDLFSQYSPIRHPFIEEIEMRCVKEIAVMLVTGIVLAWGTPGVRAAEPKVGEAAPAFSLPGSDGKTYTLADFKGKSAVVVAWFPKAFTGG
jgi:AhpC/TSA family